MYGIVEEKMPAGQISCNSEVKKIEGAKGKLDPPKYDPRMTRVDMEDHLLTEHSFLKVLANSNILAFINKATRYRKKNGENKSD